jgi:transcriptional regulator with XRE-family HTH domain
MLKGKFDAEGFFAAIDSHRLSKDLTWKQVAKESGVSASTLTRMAQGKRPDVDSLAALSRWSGQSTDDFILEDDDPVESSPLAKVTAQFRRDSNLTPDAKRAIEATLKALYQHFSKASKE